MTQVEADEAVPAIDVYDELGVKRTLDEQATKIFEELGFQENHYWSNIKALIAQFYPKPFPESKPEISFCVGGYIVVSVLLQIILMVVDKEYIMFSTYPNAVEAGLDGKAHPMKVKTEFPRFQEFYTLTIEVHEKGKAMYSAVSKTSVGKYFSEEGEFDKEAFKSEISNTIKALRKKNK